MSPEHTENPSDESNARQSFFERLFRKQPKTTTQAVPQARFALNLEKLAQARVMDIATPKANIVALPVDTEMEEFFNTVREHGYSRIPVYRETLDDPIGLVHIKDVFMTYGVQLDASRFSLEPFIRPVIYAPPSMRLITLLQHMQNEHIHMALVIDEYGGVDGLLTIEDILEQIVGEITDEHDDEDDELWVQEKPGVYLVQARTEIDDFSQEIGHQLPQPEDEEEVDTIGGLIITLASRVPAKGEIIKAEDGTEFEIVEADPRRIKRVRVRLPLLHLDAEI